MKYWKYWDNLQLLPTKKNLPKNATYLKADKDEGYFVDEGEFEVWYGDGSNRLREFMENLIAIPAKVFFWKRPPEYLKNMYYSYANVSMELNKTPRTPKKRLWRKPKEQYGLIGAKISNQPKKAVMHSRGVWMLGQMLKLINDGCKVDELICYGIPKTGGQKFVDEIYRLVCLGVKVTIITVDGDWVVNRPAYGKKLIPTRPIFLLNLDNLKGIKAIHTSYGLYLERKGL